MTIYFNHPPRLHGKLLDNYLARGWFRMGQDIFTCRYLISSGMLHTAVWLRLPLEGYDFTKTLRKLLRKNERNFECTVSPFVLNAEKEELYQRYRACFKAPLSETMRESLYEENRNIYDSWQTEIRENGKLVAFSVFDKGQTSMQSISGIYDPDYSRHSLGLTTILLEARHGLDQGLEQYYIGYYAPGNPDFDYKLRLGSLEYMDSMSRLWHPVEDVDLNQLPSTRLFKAFAHLADELESRGIPCRLCLHPAYRFVVVNEDLKGAFLCEPLYLECHPERFEQHLIFITYCIESEEYTLHIGELMQLFQLPQQLLIERPSGPHVCQQVVKPICSYGTSADSTEIAGLLKSTQSLI